MILHVSCHCVEPAPQAQLDVGVRRDILPEQERQVLLLWVEVKGRLHGFREEQMIWLDLEF